MLLRQSILIQSVRVSQLGSGGVMVLCRTAQWHESGSLLVVVVDDRCLMMIDIHDFGIKMRIRDRGGVE